MRIVEVVSGLYRHGWKYPVRDGMHTYAERGTILTRIRTASGTEGFGWTTTAVGLDKALLESARVLGGHAVGLHVYETERLAQLIYQTKHQLRGLAARALASVDIAMWDAAGKSAGVPLYRMLGGCCDRVPVYLAGATILKAKGCRSWSTRCSTKWPWGPST